jgi:hypothetical protein
VSDAVKITRPFTITFTPDIAGGTGWDALIVGHELDNMTFGPTPEAAAYMAFDLLCALTEKAPRDVIASLDADEEVAP